MQLAEPHRIEAPAFGAVHELERLRERLRVGSSRQGRELMEDTEFHCCRFPMYSFDGKSKPDNVTRIRRQENSA